MEDACADGRPGAFVLVDGLWAHGRNMSQPWDFAVERNLAAGSDEDRRLVVERAQSYGASVADWHRSRLQSIHATGVATARGQFGSRPPDGGARIAAVRRHGDRRVRLAGFFEQRRHGQFGTGLRSRTCWQY